MSRVQGAYEIRKYAVSGPGAKPTTAGVRFGDTKDAASLSVTLNWTARHFTLEGHEVIFNPGQSLYVKNKSGSWTLYVVRPTDLGIKVPKVRLGR